MKIEKIKLSDLREDPSNVRDHTAENIEMIARSLKEHGQYKPIIVDVDTMTVMVGNGRLRAMRRLGWAECDCILVEWGGKEGMEVMDNRLNELSAWNKRELHDWLLEEKDLDWWGVDAALGEQLIKETKKHSSATPVDRPKKEPPKFLCPHCGEPLVKAGKELFI